MSLDAETIQIIVDAKSQEADQARKSLAALGQQVKTLKGWLDAGSISQAAFESGFAKLDGQIARTKANLHGLESQIRDVGGKMTGATRAGAVSRAGMFGANTLQDMIQGGPASGINNILGAANDGGIKALAGEALAAAGGIRVVAAALGTVAAVAGTTFLLIDQGLKSNKLGWTDLGSVIDTMAGGVFSGTWENIKTGFNNVNESISEVVGGTSDLTIGWNEAAEAVLREKQALDLATASLKAYLAASKALAGVKSAAQKEGDEFGKSFATELAEMGGKGGLGSMIDRMANSETRGSGKDENGKDRMVTVPTLNEKGEVDGEEQITRREQARRRITTEVAQAQSGDVGAQERIKQRLGSMGDDPTNLGGRAAADKAFAEGDDRDIQKEEDDRKWAKEKKARASKAGEKADEETARLDDMDIAKEEADRKAKKEKRKDQDKAAMKKTAGTGFDARVDQAMLRSALANGGKTGAAAEEVARMISKELQDKGVDADTADRVGRKQAEEHAASLGDKVNERAMEPGPRKTTHMGSADFVRSVEQAGEDKVAGNTEKMIGQLAELVRLKQRGPRLMK